MSCLKPNPDSLHSRVGSGFTLVEVLIALSLTTVLVLAVWQMLDVHQALAERGSRQAASSQIVRGLFHQLRGDLDGLRFSPPGERDASSWLALTRPSSTPAAGNAPAGVPPMSAAGAPSLSAAGAPSVPAASAPPMPPDTGFPGTGGASFLQGSLADELDVPADVEPLKPIGLIGESDWMVLDVSLAQGGLEAGQVVPPTGLGESDWDTSGAPWQRVVYRFVLDPLEDEQDVLSGYLQRTVLTLADIGPLDDLLAELREEPTIGYTANETLPPLDSELNTGLVETDELAVESSPEPPQNSDDITEIVWCRFRYYDGQRWRGSWQTSQRKKLPVAVVCHFLLEDELPQALTDPDTEIATPSDTIDDGFNRAPWEALARAQSNALFTDEESTDDLEMGFVDEDVAQLRLRRMVFALPGPRRETVTDTSSAGFPGP